MFVPESDRLGNKLPPIADLETRSDIGRESMLFSYRNSVADSYVGDIRHFVMKFGDYLSSKNKFYDVAKNEYVEFPIRFSAPNLVFSDDKGLNGVAKETSLKDRIILPVISYYLSGMDYDSKRAIDPCVRHSFKQSKDNPSRALVTTAPKPMNYSFQVDIWTETRETLNQLVTAFQLDFNPYSYLTDLYNYDDPTQKSNYQPYCKMNLDSYSDQSNFVPGSDRRVVRGTLKITIEGFLSQPPKEVPYVFNSPILVSLSSSTSANNTVTSTPIVNNTIDPFFITLGSDLVSGSLFRIINNKAYKVTSVDSILPAIDGITLESGKAGDIIRAGGKTGSIYSSNKTWNVSGTVYLNQLGTLTLTEPSPENKDKYLVPVGTSISGTNTFEFSVGTITNLR